MLGRSSSLNDPHIHPTPTHTEQFWRGTRSEAYIVGWIFKSYIGLFRHVYKYTCILLTENHATREKQPLNLTQSMMKLHRIKNTQDVFVSSFTRHNNHQQSHESGDKKSASVQISAPCSWQHDSPFV